MAASLYECAEADLEAGMYYGGGKFSKYNPQNKPLIHPFVSLYLRGRTDGFALKGGDATKGKLQVMYDGPRPWCNVSTITPPHPDAGASICTRQKNNPYNVERNITPSYQPMHKQVRIAQLSVLHFCVASFPFYLPGVDSLVREPLFLRRGATCPILL